MGMKISTDRIISNINYLRRILQRRIAAIVLLMIVPSILGGCKTYNNAFSCGDATGAKCMSMDNVDRMITSGEIERFNEARNKSNCRGRSCNGARTQDEIFLQTEDNGDLEIIYLDLKKRNENE